MKVKVGKTYLLYILAVLTTALLFSAYTGLGRLNELLEEKINSMERAYRNLHKIKIQYQEVQKEVHRLNLKPVSRDEAVEIILQKADRILKIYDGKVVQDIQSNGNYYSIVLGFDYYPDTPEDLYDFIRSLGSSIYPVISVRQFRYLQTKNGTKVYFELELIQPFIAGKGR